MGEFFVVRVRPRHGPRAGVRRAGACAPTPGRWEIAFQEDNDEGGAVLAAAGCRGADRRDRGAPRPVPGQAVHPAGRVAHAGAWAGDDRPARRRAGDAGPRRRLGRVGRPAARAGPRPARRVGPDRRRRADERLLLARRAGADRRRAARRAQAAHRRRCRRVGLRAPRAPALARQRHRPAAPGGPAPPGDAARTPAPARPDHDRRPRGVRGRGRSLRPDPRARTSAAAHDHVVRRALDRRPRGPAARRADPAPDAGAVRVARPRPGGRPGLGRRDHPRRPPPPQRAGRRPRAVAGDRPQADER